MKMISYWSEDTIVYNDNGLVLIIGYYNHKNKKSSGHKALGIHWSDYPQSRGILSPCVIPKETRNAMLSGLLHTAISNNDTVQRDELIKAIDFFK